MNRKRAPYIIIAGALIIGVLVFGIGLLFNMGPRDNTRLIAKIYFMTDFNTVDYEEYPVQIQGDKEMASEVLSKFIQGPKSVNLHRTMPEGLKIIEPSIIRTVPGRGADSVFVINFSKEYYNMRPEDEMFFRASLVWTMTSLSFIKNVEILVENEEAINSMGVAMGPQNQQNIDISTILDPFNKVSKTVTLYFADKTGARLLPERRTIVVNPDVLLEQYIVEAIIKGPAEDGHYPVISPDVKLVNSVERREGICSVNLNGDFLSKGPSSPVTDEVAVYSIVDSLMEVPGVKKVQFLIDSDNVGKFKGNIDLSLQFDRNAGLIGSINS